MRVLSSPFSSVAKLRPNLVRLTMIGFLIWVVFAALINVLKAMPAGPQELGVHYWTMTYEAGFMRRALVGTLFQGLIGGPPDLLRQRILLVHLTLAAGLFVGLLAWSYSLARGGGPRVRRALFVGTAAFFLSELPTTVLSLAGYLDVVLLTVAALGAYFVGRRKPLLAAGIAVFGPLAHDAFVFLWLPVLLIEGRRVVRVPRDERRHRIVASIPLLAPLVAAILASKLHSIDAARQMVERAPVASELKAILHQITFDQTARSAFEMMRLKFLTEPEQVELAAAFFCPPAVVISSVAFRIDSDPVWWRRIAFAAIVAIAPCAVLLIAWDLSRFLLWGTFAAFLLLLDNGRDGTDTSKPEPTRGLSFTAADVLALTALTALSCGPHVYAYFEMAFASRWTHLTMLRSVPSAKISYAFLRRFNRHQFDRRYSTRDHCEVEAPQVRKFADCEFELQPTQALFTKFLWLSQGEYRAVARTSPSNLCPEPAVLEIWPDVTSNFADGHPRLRTKFDASTASTQTITFSVTEEEASMERARVNVSAVAGCFRLEEVRIERLEN